MRYTIAARVIALNSIIIFSGCINLKNLNTYSESAVKSLRNYEELGYNFSKACNEKCVAGQIEKQILTNNCECNADEKADSINLVLYKAVKGYFEGLAKLSDHDLTNYKFTAVTKELKEGDFGETKINKSQADAYAKISSILSRSVTDGYRKRKISTYIGEANASIKILLEALEFTLTTNLAKKAEVNKQRVESYYFEMLKNKNVSVYEKKKIIEEYNSHVTETGNRVKRINSFAKGLHTIAAGHQKIFDNRGKLKGREVLEMLVHYSSDLQDMMDEFNTLKNK